MSNDYAFGLELCPFSTLLIQSILRRLQNMYWTVLMDLFNNFPPENIRPQKTDFISGQ